ncbi:glycoside hydrolase family 26 protein [Polaribacter sp. Asnod6-C07]|uniref:glycoside hydrolase family 26 protein n=1 Tax=Polaribacter sp. Asnod6-C07 TaxID=3160582 RepID=UPI0038652440
MASSKKTFKRLFNVLIALALGYIVIYGLAAVSKSSKGPLGGFLESMSNMVQDFERDNILEKREKNREKKLAWFKDQRKNKFALLKTKHILFGASDDSKGASYENIINLEDSLAITFPIIHIYKAWGEGQDYEFPRNEIDAIVRVGSIPMVTWEPWLGKFTQENFPEIAAPEVRNNHGLASVAKGHYDAFIKEWALEAKKVGYPIYLRVGHEMNDPYRYPWGPQNNDPSEYVAAYQHIREVFDAVGATNIIWIWSPHLTYGKFQEYYPGTDYVDVVATGALNYGTSTSWSDWWSFEQIFGNYYKQLESFYKPIMIAEFGSLKPGGNRAEWFGDTFRDFYTKYPYVTSIVFFHYSSDGSTTYKNVSWYIKDDNEVTTAIKDELKKWPASIKQPGME